jgi:E3 ubiquitin-protein ligase HERC2
LQDKKIVDIQAGGYHMLALTDSGEVYSWGGAEYGQTGHGHSNSVYTPTLIEGLSGRSITRITCGSGHSCCWSVIKDENKLLPEKIPEKYESLKEVFSIGLVHRIRLLNNISNEVFGSLALIPIQPGNEKLNFGFSKIKSMLKFEEKIRVLRSTLSSSSTPGDYGPTLQLNRWLAGKNKSKSIFFQVGSQLADQDGKSLRYERRVYKVEFFGEGAIDAGGPYNESISEISMELMNERTPVLEKTPNGKAKVGYNQDCLVPTTRSSPQDMVLFKFLGRFIGFAIRTKSPIAVKIAKPVWKKLLGFPITPADIKEIDENFVKSHECLLKVEEDGVTEDTFEYLPLELFPPITYQGGVIEISWATRVQYVNAAYALKYRQWDKQIEQIKVGLNEIVPIQILSLFSPEEVETLVCGSAEFNWNLLKQNTKYSGDFTAAHDTIKYLWETLESFNPTESELFLRFVWGKTRLPNSSSDFSHTFEVQSLSGRADAFPTSATCFFKLNLPVYLSKDVLKEKLLYAIENCTRIDSDNNAGNIEEYEEEDAVW